MKSFVKPFIPFIVILITFSIIGIAPVVIMYLMYETQPILATSLGVFINLAIAIIPLVWYIRKYGCDEFIINKKSFLPLLTALLLIFSFDMIFYYSFKINYLQDGIFHRWGCDSAAISMKMIEYTSRLLILSPILRAILFIGFLQKPLSEKINPYWAILIAVIISLPFSSTFAIKDMLFNFLTGLIYGYIYYKTKNLSIPMLCCFLVNAFSIYFSNSPHPITTANYVFLIMLPVVFCLSAVYFYRKTAK